MPHYSFSLPEQICFFFNLCHFNDIIVYSFNYISLLSYIRLYVSGRMLSESDDADEHNGDVAGHQGRNDSMNYQLDRHLMSLPITYDCNDFKIWIW